MKIEIVKEEPCLYTITINNDVILQTTVADEFSTEAAIGWVKEVRKIYCGKKKKNKAGAQTLAIGLYAEHSVNYKYGNFVYPSSKANDGPYEILQICVGNHCLIHVPQVQICKALRELLSDNNVIVFGVGMDMVAKKIEKDFGLRLSKPWELRKLAECAKDLEPGYYRKYNMEKLAVAVLGEEREVVKPDGICWYKNADWFNKSFSDEKIKYGAVDAFLAYEMGMKFLEKGTIDAFPEYEKWQKEFRAI